MNESSASSLLLNPECKYSGRPGVNDEEKDDDNEHDWWASDSGSSTGSYYSDTDSSSVEWESDISASGEVFYIESATECLTDNNSLFNEMRDSPQPELTRRRSTRAGKLMRLIRRKESKRWSTRNKKNSSGFASGGTRGSNREGNKEVTFREFQVGEIKQVTLWVDPEKRHKLGRRATLCEAYFGITPGVFSDKTRVMVAGFIPDADAMKNRNVKIGDWLRSVNSTNVTYQNLDHVLSEITGPTNVTLELQRVAGVDVTEKLPPLNSPRQSALVQQLLNKEESKELMESLMDCPIGILYLRTSELSETEQELQGVLYSFPRSESKSNNSILCNARGAFITLNHLLPGTVGLQPVSSTIHVTEEDVHVIFTPRDEELLLIALPNKCCSLEEAVNFSADIVKTLEFVHQSLTKCFTGQNNHPALDHLFVQIVRRLLDIKSYVEDNEKREMLIPPDIENVENYKFHSCFSVSNFVQLPRDAQIQIDAALSEMEAMDYRDWNEDPMDCQRLYTILGSCIYHKSYLLGSHLMHEDLTEVHSYLRHNGILNLVNTEPVNNLVIWKKVYPLSCNRGNIDATKSNLPLVPNGKWFLLIIGYGNDLLAVLLESGGCTAKCDDTMGPDVFYVEEAQETLKHIRKIGVTTLAAKWIESNARPEVINCEDQITTKSSTSITENILGLIKSTDTQTIATKQSPCSTTKKSHEIPSILKKRNVDESPMILGSVYSLQTSEDSMSQGTGGVSEISDEAMPILGRRATREKSGNTARYSEDSDSDIDIYKNDSRVLNMDISNIRENLLNQAEYLIPKKLTTGDKNYLYHYVHLDMTEGILLSSKSIDRTIKDNQLLVNFNKCVQTIHKLLHNTVRFKKMLNQDLDKTVINKSLIAIKEHGVLFDWEDTTYWVVGRLYTTPHPKELYVCYQDTAPQNLIEIAFQL